LQRAVSLRTRILLLALPCSPSAMTECKNAANDTNNALHKAADADASTPCVTLEYAAYMN